MINLQRKSPFHNCDHQILSQNLSLKENRSGHRFEASGAVRVYRPEQKVVRWAILFKLNAHRTNALRYLEMPFSDL